MALSKAVGDVLRVVAPTLAAALGGPLGPLAAAVATAALEHYLPADPAAKPGAPRVATPAEIAVAVQQNQAQPDFALALRQAELDLQKYEAQAEIRFAEIEAEDRKRAGDLQRDTGTADAVRRRGFGLVYTGMALLFATVGGSLVLISGVVQIPADAAGVVAGLFSLIGVAIGYVNGWASQVVNFYYGSSSGSQKKTDEIATTMRDLGTALGDAASNRPPPPPPPVVVVPPQPTTPVPHPVQHTDWRQSPFGGVRWRVTEEGIVLEGEAKPRRTVGEPTTIRRIWASHGPLIAAACAKHQVPAEVVCAVIATESGGRASATLTEPDGRTSSGIMQVLTATASEVLNRPVTVEELKDPEVSIAAGVGYIASQAKKTDLDPILVAAAYNAGGLYPPRERDDNPFRLRSTGTHLNRMMLYFNDAVFVAKADGWGRAS